MKTTITNNLLRLGLTAAAAALIPSASASVLIAGFDDFVATNYGNVPPVTTAGDGPLASSSTMAGEGFRLGNPNSTTGSYGGTNIAATVDNGRFGLAAPTLAENFTPRNASVFIENTSAASYKLESFVFDAGLRNSGTPGVGVTIDYAITGTTPASGSFITSVVSTEFTPFIFSLLGFELNPGDTISFTVAQAVNAGNQVVIDNVGLLAVPEPSGVLALGLLVGSGAFLRNRRRNLAS